MNRLKDKVAIITGAGSGMGFAAVKLFAEEGAAVVGVDIKNLDKIQALNLPNVKAMKLDVTKEEEWQEVTAKVAELYTKIDILVNNAGFSTGYQGILEMTQQNWDRVMNINVKGVWLGMKAVIPYMQKNGGGSIVNTSSTAALYGGVMDGGNTAYAASKAAVLGLTTHAANAFGKDNIRVNAVLPGCTNTGGCGGEIPEEEARKVGEILANEIPIPLKMADPVDIAYTYLFLASDESRFATGARFTVDGGSVSH